MCSVLLLRRPPSEPWAVLIAANRDEMHNRPWLPPAMHWEDRPEVIAGRDQLGGGTWMGLNTYGVTAVLLARHHSLGPEKGKRSRGELVLEALEHADAKEAADALRFLNAAAYRPFNLIVADNHDAFWLYCDGIKGVTAVAIPYGYSMITSGDLTDRAASRVAWGLDYFSRAPLPDPSTHNWLAWEMGLKYTHTAPAGTGLWIPKNEHGFGTTSSSLLALPGISNTDEKPQWLFCSGREQEFSSVL